MLSLDILICRAFKQADVPTTVSKHAPDFCSIYVVAKGKLASVKPALRVNKVTVDQSSLVTSKATVNPFQTVKSKSYNFKIGKIVHTLLSCFKLIACT